MNDKKVLLALYHDSADNHMNILERFDGWKYQVHVFDNVDIQAAGDIELKPILWKILKENPKKYEISIISDIEKLILDLHKKHSWDYNSFIFDNNTEVNQCTAKSNNDNVCELNFNLYSLKKWEKCNYSNIFNQLADFEFSFSKLTNFLNSAEEISDDYDELLSNYYKVDYKANKIKEYILDLDRNTIDNIEKTICEKFNAANELLKIYLSSFLLNTFKKSEYAEMILNTAINSKSLDANNRFFIRYQLISAGFTDINISNAVRGELQKQLYDKVFEEFSQNVGEYKFIPKKKRNEDLVFVITSQFLTLEHGPTKTALDRCYSLIKYMNKRVILINTAELLTARGIVAMNNITFGSNIAEYTKLDKFPYKDIEVPYYQPNCAMPDVSECINILNLVKKYKPYMIFNIGGNSVVADLSSKIVPTVTISTAGGYAVPPSKGQFFVIGRKPTENDYNQVISQGNKKEALIESLFTFDLKAQEHEYTRKEFTVPEDKFIIAMIGGRLQREVDEEFLDILDKLALKGAFIVSIGGYNLSERHQLKYINLKDNFKDLGFQEDILACIEQVDLYINPNRIGGGTSAVEAMYKSKPVLALNHGDVSILVEDEFTVDDYDEMLEVADKYINDRNFYDDKSKKAKKRAAELMDTKKHFRNLYNTIESSPLFK
ncbi:glycosyltransferase [Inconstantimicrobium mannanitabidum]|uniref:Flavodoxin n=1 Tax=Inconstantimicrobium mannanitabidum TaxID=1604901 RepID=A0ACB5R8F6_9CLOT|nr:glycosyltransferase [Clostridium sp. TW13]GKX65478.1 flavodoxin [Clostridium sp. TW13]